jgi:hypothetical protein
MLLFSPAFPDSPRIQNCENAGPKSRSRETSYPTFQLVVFMAIAGLVAKWKAAKLSAK